MPEETTRDQLLDELSALRQRVEELEKVDTERHRTAATLGGNVRRYRILRDSEADFFFTLDMDSKITSLSGVVERTLGYPPEEANTLWQGIDAVTPQTIKIVGDALRQMRNRLARDGRPTSCTAQMEFIRRDGTTLLAECNFNVMRGRDGKPVGFAGVATDVTKQRRAEKALQYLSRRLLELQEMERRNTARELHDEVGQALTGLKLLLGEARRSPAKTGEILAEAQGMIGELMTRISGMSRDLRPPMLDDLGILPTLVWHFGRYTEHTGVRVKFQHRGLNRRFSPAVEITLYRIVQEALTNVARHAGVNEVSVQVHLARGTLDAVIEDHGKGFEPEADLTGGSFSGIVGMRERALSLGGRFEVHSRPGQGTRLTVQIPVRSAAGEEVSHGEDKSGSGRRSRDRQAGSQDAP